MSDRTALIDLESASSLCAVFQRHALERADEVALRSFDSGQEYTWAEYDARVRRIAAGLASLGVGRGDTVALMMTNRPEFHFVDTAAIHLGATPFSIYNSSSPEQIDYFFATAGARVVVCEEQFLERIRGISRIRGIHTIVCIDAEVDGTRSLDQLEAVGSAEFDFEAAWREVGREDVLTLIFSSGTTGLPKAIELTHANLLYTTGALLEFPQGLGASARGATMVSYLPDAHLANRMFAYYLPMTTGATVVTVRDGKSVAQALSAVRPTMFVGVPMIWYRIKTAVEQIVARETGERKALLTRALESALEKVRLEAADAPVSVELRERCAEADRQVLADLRAKLGLDNLVAGISGGAPIAAEALLFIMALGIPVVEGWAMSETSGAGLCNAPDRIRPGTVGPVVKGSDVRRAPDGELLLRGPGVMKGYRNEPEKTAEAIDPDGWLHTGDVATIDEDGFVTIVDRKKELIINTAGKNMSPAHIENSVKIACPLVGSVVAIGDRRPYVSALITLEPEAVGSFATAHGIRDTSPESLAGNPHVTAEIQAGIDRANATLSRVEGIKRFTVLPTYWLPDSDVVTPTMKLKRKVIDEKYADEIEEIYSRPDTRVRPAEQGA